MITNKVKTVEEAVGLLEDNSTLAIGGSGGGVDEPGELMRALGDRFQRDGHPSRLTVLHATGLGDREKTGLGYLAHEGLVKRIIGGHYGMAPRMTKLVVEGKVEGYNFPQGVISQLYREIAAGRPGVITHVGIGTYVDPRLAGGKLNDRTTEDLVELIEIHGREWLFYPTIPLDAVFLRGTTADERGNITMEHEAAVLEAIAAAQAAHNQGGRVIVQVKRLARHGTLDPRLVRIPGNIVDVVVLAPEQWQVCERKFDPSLCGEVKIPLETIKPMELTERKVIARRAAMEIKPHATINLGYGMPDGVASVMTEERANDYLTLSVEQGPVGGVPQGGVIFGCAANPDAFVESPTQFDFYDGGGLDLACLGAAQVDSEGNVNSSRFAGNLAGCGGFIDISQNAKTVVFCGTFTAGGLKTEVGNGELRIRSEGRHRKFVRQVEEITFSARISQTRKQRVLYVTERAVFELAPEGLVLCEIAPGVDLDRDILAHMDFRPVVRQPLALMERRIFDSGRMGLLASLEALSEKRE